MNKMGWQIDDPARLATLRECGILDTPVDPDFDAITAEAAGVCSAPMAIINLIADDRQWFKSRFGTDLVEPPLQDSLCKHTLTNGAELVICDLSKDVRTSQLSLVSSPEGARFFASVPIVVRGQALGALTVVDFKPRPEGLTTAQQAHLSMLTKKVSDLIAAR